MNKTSGRCSWMEETDIKHVTPLILLEPFTAVNVSKKVQGVTGGLPQAGDFRGGTPREGTFKLNLRDESARRRR